MKKRKLSKLLMTGVLMTFMAGTLMACTNKSSNKNVTVRVGYFPNVTHSQALIGKQNGDFQKALGKNKIEWKQFNAGPSEVEALFAGGIDIGYIGPGPAINAYAKSKGDVQIIAGAADAGAELVTRKDVVIKDVKELSGKKVAVPQFGNTQDLSLRNLLSENGLKDTTKGGTVEVRQADNPDIKTLFEKKEIDAALVPEPWGSRLIKETGANVALDYNKVWRDGKYTTAVIIVRKKFLKQHPDIVENFLKAHVEITQYINKNKSEAEKTVNNQLKELTGKALAGDVLDSAFDRITITSNPEKASVNGFVDLSVKSGFLKTKPDTKNLFDLTILNKVLKSKHLSQIN